MAARKVLAAEVAFNRPALQNKKKLTGASVSDIIIGGSLSGMPGFADTLKEQERADIPAYLKTL